jgi:hypothetical protein
MIGTAMHLPSPTSSIIMEILIQNAFFFEVILSLLSFAFLVKRNPNVFFSPTIYG